MKIASYLVTLLVLIVFGLFAITRFQTGKIEKQFPAIGSTAELGGRLIHFVHVPEGDDDSALPPILFIHGASGNARDQMGAYQSKLEGKARLIFIDRPGHGHSERIDSDDTLSGQAAVYRALLDELDIGQAIIVCHSMGCASGAALAVEHPEKVKGLVFVAPATHPWPGDVSWYYTIGAMPIIGTLFTEIISLPAGLLSMDAGVKSVFSPNEVPDDYLNNSGVKLVLRPASFRANSRDVKNLNPQVKQLQPRYSEIKKPTVIVTGNQDDIVSPEIHSVGLETDIEGAELVIKEGVGHKPDYVMTDQVIEAIRKVGR